MLEDRRDQAIAVMQSLDYSREPESMFYLSRHLAMVKAPNQAVAMVGEHATPEHFVVARANAALTRLLPRDPQAQRWLQRRWWHPAWLLLAAALGWVGGMLVDQLGPPQQVNLLAPAVWALVAWNLLVCAAALAPRSWSSFGRREASAWWLSLGRQGSSARL